MAVGAAAKSFPDFGNLFESGIMKKSVLLALAVASPAAICGQDAQTVDVLKQELRELRQRTERLEEAWAETTSLPWNLTLRAGQLLTDFGRLNPTHPYTWNFVDTPLVSARLMGPDGMRNPGARLSWLTPTPFYSELSFSLQNSAG